jgi:hypothetical protein
MADRGLEALIILLLVLVVASLALVPAQPLRLLGAELLVAGAATLAIIVRLQRAYFQDIGPPHRGRARRTGGVSRVAASFVALAGAVLLLLGDAAGLYLLPPGILLSFYAAAANAWVLLIEINR